MHIKEEEPQDPTKNYDTRDLPMAGVIKGVAVFFIFTIVMGPVSCAAMSCLGGEVERPYLGQEPLPMQDPNSYQSRRIPGDPNPILQDNFSVRSDIHNVRKAENELLDKGGTNPTTKTRTIPIDEAITMEAQRQGG